MIIAIYDVPTSDEDVWSELRVGTVTEFIDYEYEKLWCGVGSFELTVPADAADVDKFEVDRIIKTPDGAFMIRVAKFNEDNVKVSGYDLNCMLMERITAARTEDGKDYFRGKTGAVVYHYVYDNCMGCEDAARNYPAFVAYSSVNNVGIDDDAASPRLENLESVVTEICKAQGLGWRIDMFDSTAGIHFDRPALFTFRISEPEDHTAGQQLNDVEAYSYAFGNAEVITEKSTAGAKNTLYCELTSGLVQTYSPDDTNRGFARKEEYARLKCELDELEIYAKHTLADRYAPTCCASLNDIPADGEDISGTHPFGLGHVITMYDRHSGLEFAELVTAVKIKRNPDGTKVRLSVGENRARLLDSARKRTGTVETWVKNLRFTENTESYTTGIQFISDNSFDLSFAGPNGDGTNNFTIEEGPGVLRLINNTAKRTIEIAY